MKRLYVALGLMLWAGSQSSACVTSLTPGMDIAGSIRDCPAGTTYQFAAGLYRGVTVTAKNNDIFVGQPGTVFNGAVLVSAFTRQGNQWVATGLPAAQDDGRDGLCDPSRPYCTHPQDVYFDDQPFINAGSAAAVVAGTYYFDRNTGTLTIANDPAGHKVELGATSYAFIGDAQDVTVHNFTVEKYANIGQTGAVGGNQWGGSAPIHWSVQNCEIRLNHGAGVALLARAEVLNNFIHHNGQEGYAINGQQMPMTMEGNELSFNNYAGYAYSFEVGGGKAAKTSGAMIRNNYAHDNNGPGLWTDIDNINTTYIGNVVTNNLMDGIIHEISYDAKILQNTLTGNGLGRPASFQGILWGDQIMVFNSVNVEVASNTIVVSAAGGNAVGLLDGQRNDYGNTYRLQNVYVHHNDISMLGNANLAGALSNDPLNSSHVETSNRFDYNRYHAANLFTTHWMWNRIMSWSEFRSAGQEAHGSLDSVYRAQLTSPIPGSRLSYGTANFTWAAVAGATQYRLTLGSALGQADLWSASFSQTSQSIPVPSDGRTLYVRLETFANGQWQAPLDYRFDTAAFSPLPWTALITDKTLTTLKPNYGWSGFAGMRIQTGRDPLLVTALGRISIPGNSTPHPLRLVKEGAATPVNWDGPADFYGTDVPGGSLTILPFGADNEFTYGFFQTPVVLAANSAYYLVSQENDLGDTYYNSDTHVGTTPDAAVTGVVYGTDMTNFWVYYAGQGSTFGPVDLRYIAIRSATIQSPAASAILTGTNATFQWNDTGAAKYHLDVGSTPGGTDYFSGDVGRATSQRVAGLPSDGRTLYAQVISSFSVYGSLPPQRITVQAVQNQAPSVSAGADQSLTWPTAMATVSGTASDDGLPAGTLQTSWSQISGPGTVSFDNNSAITTIVRFSASGVYGLRLSATDGALTSVSSLTVTVGSRPNSPPTAVAVADRLSGRSPLTVHVDGSGSSDDGSIVSYAWTFGDNTQASGVTASHTYTWADRYPVSLTVTDNGGLTASTTLYISVINSSPTAVAMVSPLSGQLPLTVQMDASSSSDADGRVESVRWTFGDGQQASGAKASHVFTQAGSFAVTAFVTDNGGAVSSSTTIVTVSNPPPPNQPPGVSAITTDVADADPITPGFQLLENSALQLMATATDPEGDPLQWQWSYIRNQGTPTLWSSGPGSPAPARFFYPLGSVNSVYQWTLTVTDSHSAAKSKTFTVYLTSVASSGGVVLPLPAPAITLDSVVVIGSHLKFDYPYAIPLSHVLWSFVPSEFAAVGESASSAQKAVAWTTPLLETDLSTPDLAPGSYRFTLTVFDTQGRSAASNTVDLTLVSPVSGGRAYPNPWRPTSTAQPKIIFDQWDSGSTIMLFTVSARHVKTLAAPEGRAEWLLDNDSGESVAAGIYLYRVSAPSRPTQRGKLVIIR